MIDEPDKTAFLAALRDSFGNGTFLKLALGKHRGEGAAARCTATRVLLKDVPHLRLVTQQGARDTTRNFDIEAAVAHLAQLIGGDYLSATLFTAQEDVSLVYSRKRVGRMTRSPPTMSEAPPTEHDRSKAYVVDAAAPFLLHLGITHTEDRSGRIQVRPSMFAKYRQICRFVEILDQLIGASPVKAAERPRVVDIGSGKGYLTFALHQHLKQQLGRHPQTLGLEANRGLADQCTAVAAACGIEGLTFAAVRAETFAKRQAGESDEVDILIALHACDTATDDAIHLGIIGRAALIVCAPCCQHEIAPQIAARSSEIDGLLKFGLLKQRQADLVTDAARALLLEAHGYEVRIIEFVSTEHTAKNLMIAAVRSDDVDRRGAAEQYRRLAAFAGFERHRLHDLLTGTR